MRSPTDCTKGTELGRALAVILLHEQPCDQQHERLEAEDLNEPLDEIGSYFVELGLNPPAPSLSANLSVSNVTAALTVDTDPRPPAETHITKAAGAAINVVRRTTRATFKSTPEIKKQSLTATAASALLFYCPCLLFQASRSHPLTDVRRARTGVAGLGKALLPRLGTRHDA